MRDVIKKHLDYVDGVVFDFGGVIVKAPEGDWGLYDLCKEYGLPREAVDEGNDKYRRLFDRGDFDCRELYRRIFADNGIDLTGSEEFFDNVYRIDSQGWMNYSEETLETMRELKALGKKVGILSNMSPIFYHEFFVPQAKEYRALCDSEVISSHHHIAKPEKAIYDLSAKEMGIEPSRLLFLDDNVKNVEGAIASGWRAEVYRA